jgi:glucokinase
VTPAAAGPLPARRIGIDVGGTKALGVAIDPDGVLLDEQRHLTPRGAASVGPLIDTLADLARALRADAAVGVGVPGLVTSGGVLRAAPNLDGVADLTVADLLADRLGFPVVVDNDATCAAVAELELGVARGMRDVVLATLGTGIGGAVISDGAVRRGHNGFAGEFGHMVVDPDGPACPCGRRGCWERYASGEGLTRLAREAAAAGLLDAALRAEHLQPDAVSGEDVERWAVAGDRDALAVIDDFARWVALGLANLTNALDPQMLVVGGGLSSGAELLRPPIRRWLGELLYQSNLRTVPRVEFAALGERAGAIGAALLGGRHAQHGHD